MDNHEKNITDQHTPRHFLDLKDFSSEFLKEIIHVARHIKKLQENRKYPLHPKEPLLGKELGILLSKPSTRTRISFEVGIRQLGGDSVNLNPHDMQLGRGETIADTARVLSRFLDGIVIRTGKTQDLTDFAQWSQIPVINGLTPTSHPMQILADVMTFEEYRGPIEGKIFAWLGDNNNVLHSLIEAAVKFNFQLRIATPKVMKPSTHLLAPAQKDNPHILWTDRCEDAIQDANCVITDTWLSLSDSPQEREWRIKTLTPFRVNTDLMRLASKDALFMHCLPAHVGEEVTQDVFEGKQSVVFSEAENRLHAQKAVLLWTMLGDKWRSFGAF